MPASFSEETGQTFSHFQAEQQPFHIRHRMLFSAESDRKPLRHNTFCRLSLSDGRVQV